jgi:hypothetical protein
VTRLNQLVPRRTPYPTGQSIGIEIELEQVDDFRAFRDSDLYEELGWSVTEDGSLRNNGAELISPPIQEDDITVHINAAYAAIADTDAVGSIRTGIHVHFDMTNKTIEEIGAVCAFYSLVEPALYATLPEDREQNIYCVPWYRAPDEATRLRGWLDAPSILQRVANGIKYTGLNIAALYNHGTLEFRMAPTFATAAELQRWVATLQYIVGVGIEYGTASSVLRGVAEHGFVENPLLPDIAANAMKYDSYYCAEILGGAPAPTWEVPLLDLDDVEPNEDAVPDELQDFLDGPMVATDAGDMLDRVIRYSQTVELAERPSLQPSFYTRTGSES